MLAMRWQCSWISKPSANFLRRHEAGFFEQRQIAIGIIVALNAGIAVPVPDPAEIPGMVDIAEIGNTGLLQMIAGRMPETTAAENGDIEILRDRGPRGCTGICGSAS